MKYLLLLSSIVLSACSNTCEDYKYKRFEYTYYIVDPKDNCLYKLQEDETGSVNRAQISLLLDRKGRHVCL